MMNREFVPALVRFSPVIPSRTCCWSCREALATVAVTLAKAQSVSSILALQDRVAADDGVVDKADWERRAAVHRPIIILANCSACR